MSRLYALDVLLLAFLVALLRSFRKALRLLELSLYILALTTLLLVWCRLFFLYIYSFGIHNSLFLYFYLSVFVFLCFALYSVCVYWSGVLYN
ncbi:hypothetical protein BY458DRAFT_514068 [Sporodiniella umbellata]|nr:hypothetical protein BY458DRAFT_514068 [Sporodiniella umbellata]